MRLKDRNVLNDRMKRQREHILQVVVYFIKKICFDSSYTELHPVKSRVNNNILELYGELIITCPGGQ
jgi:hypothetical protein